MLGPTFKIRIHAISGSNLAAKDRNGLSDPFLKIKLGEQKHTTHVCPKTLNPHWDDHIYMQIPVHHPPKHLLVVCWDKDRFGRDFMGTFQVPVQNLFLPNGRPVMYKNAQPQWYRLETRGREIVSGDIELQWGFVGTKRDLNRHLDWCALLEALFGRRRAMEMIELQKGQSSKKTTSSILGLSTGSGLVSTILTEALKKKEQMQQFTNSFLQKTTAGSSKKPQGGKEEAGKPTKKTDKKDDKKNDKKNDKKTKTKPSKTDAVVPDTTAAEEASSSASVGAFPVPKIPTSNQSEPTVGKTETTTPAKSPAHVKHDADADGDVEEVEAEEEADITAPPSQSIEGTSGDDDDVALSAALYGTVDHHGYFFSGDTEETGPITMPVPQGNRLSSPPIFPGPSSGMPAAPVRMPVPMIPPLTQQQQQRLLSMPEPYMHYSASDDVRPLIVIAQEAAELADVQPHPETSANEMVVAAVTAAAHAAADRVKSDNVDQGAPSVKEMFRPGQPPSRSMSLPVSGPQVLGVLFMDICSASNLPAMSNFLHTGFDMDPFVVITFGRHTFRTQAIRHSLNPEWNERLYFHLSRQQLDYPINFTIIDKDKISSNDRVAVVNVPLTDLLTDLDTQPEKTKELDALPDVDDVKPKEISLKMQPAKEGEWTGECTLNIKVRFLSYSVLRRRFWNALCRQYDSDGNGLMNRFEIATMLDSLGSTLTAETIDRFFRKHGLDPVDDELTFSQLSADLERHLFTQHGPPCAQDHSNSGEATLGPYEEEEEEAEEEETRQMTRLQRFRRMQNQAAYEEVEESGEQVIRINECPICHKPGLIGKSDTDILTHVAICTLNDPGKVDRFMMGNFVSEAQAQRRWFTKLVSRVSYGSYKIGKNNAVILVVDRRTGQLIEEKMPTYVRLGIRLLYQSIGSKRTVDSKAIRNLFQSLSFNQGKKFDNPASVRDIPHFIKFHNLNVDEILDPLDSFGSFNEFFYRKLKPNARPIASPKDPNIAVSLADARVTCFPTIAKATDIWIKGQLFSVERLLGDATLAKLYDGGSLCIFRLAPQDYHRFHVPVDGVFSEPNLIEGSYYTVNPMAIRSSLDVYGENKRIVSILDSERFGRVAYVCIGAMMVGSIVLTSQPGKRVARGDEHGYFAFGGSTVVVLFEPGKIQFDADLLENSEKPIETLLQVGNSIGCATG